MLTSHGGRETCEKKYYLLTVMMYGYTPHLILANQWSSLRSHAQKYMVGYRNSLRW